MVMPSNKEPSSNGPGKGRRCVKSLIVRDCIIEWLDTGEAVSVTHGSFFLQSSSSGGAGGHGAVVAVEDGHYPQIPAGDVGTAGPGAETVACWRSACHLATCGFGGRGAGREQVGGGAGTGLPRLQAADFNHDAHRPGSRPTALWRGAGLLLPAGPAVGGLGVFEGHPAADAGTYRDGVLAEFAGRVLPVANSGGGGERAYLRPLLAAVPAA